MLGSSLTTPCPAPCPAEPWEALGIGYKQPQTRLKERRLSLAEGACWPLHCSYQRALGLSSKIQEHFLPVHPLPPHWATMMSYILGTVQCEIPLAVSEGLPHPGREGSL